MTQLRSVLVVEDDPDIRDILEMALVDLLGIDLRMFDNVPDALQALDALQPQIIALDVMLPGVTGLEAVPMLRARPDCRDLPIVLLTAKASREHAAEYEQLDIQGVIYKPFDPLGLATELERIIDAHGRS